MLNPLVRGSCFLAAIAATTFVTMLMIDDALDELYGLAFAPIYIFELIVFVDLFLPAHAPSTDDLAMYRQPDKESRYTKCGSALNFVIWLIISILAPMRLSDYDTVPASSIGALILLWLGLVLIAQLTEKRRWLSTQPFLLRRIADYFSVTPPADNFDFDSVFKDANTEHDDAPPAEDVFDPESEFPDKRPTVRGISPPPTEQELVILQDRTSLDTREPKGKQVMVQIDRSESELAASGLEEMASNSKTFEEAIME